MFPVRGHSPRLSALLRNHVDPLPTAASEVELDLTVDQSVNREIVAETNTVAGMKLRSDLTNNDITGPDLLTAENFDVTPLSVGIATVSARTLSLFMRHKAPLVGRPTTN